MCKLPQIFSQSQIQVLNEAIMQRPDVISWFITFFRKYFWTDLIWGGFWLFQAILRPKRVQTATNFFPFSNSSLNWSHYAEAGCYLMIYNIFKKIFLNWLNLGWFLAILAVLGHCAPKNGTNSLNFFSSLKWSHYAKIICYPMIYLILQKIFLN